MQVETVETISAKLAKVRNTVINHTNTVSHRTLICRYLIEFGPANPDLVAGLLGMNIVTARARFTELHNKGFIHRCGIKRYTAARRLQWMYRIDGRLMEMV